MTVTDVLDEFERAGYAAPEVVVHEAEHFGKRYVWVHRCDGKLYMRPRH